MIRSTVRNGYVVLMTVLVVGVVSSASAIAILLLGLSIERNAFASQLSTQAFAGAWACAEHAILELKNDLEYAGNEEYTISYGYPTVQQGYPSHIGFASTTCLIYPVMGYWNENRTICTEATFGNFTRRRLEVVLSRVLPDVRISSWEEVDEVTACDDYTPAACGDNTVNTDEECDDGNTASNDGCSSACVIEYCGDSKIQNNGVETTEQCDDGSETVTCDSNCTNVSCGDGDLNTAAGEECDDGGTATGDGCDNLCRDEICGNSRVDAGETCDDGGETSACDDDCTAVTCGDGNVNEADGEECDDSGESATCNSDCTSSVCGDGITNTSAGEYCDDAGQSSSCDSDCTEVVCGDGLINEDDGEECDDGGTTPGDGCDASCQVELCPNGSIDPGEDCDDSGESATCDANCTDAICGDSTLNTTAGETCDEGGETAGCDDDCTSVSCGDGNTNSAAGEDCDDGGESVTCDSDCTAAICGDGELNTTAGEECDDDNTVDGDGCSSGCLSETSSPSDYVLYWNLDETSGSAADGSGNGYAGTVNGGAGTSTDVPTVNFSNSRSRDFDGNNDYLDYSGKVPNASAFSISFWTKNDVAPSQYDGMVCNTNGSTWSKGWGFFYNSSSQIRFFIEGTSNVAYASITPTDWNHVVGVWNGSTMQIYVNGVAGTSDSFSSNVREQQKFNVGRCGHNSFNIDGKVDDVRVYERALTTVEITALANGN